MAKCYRYLKIKFISYFGNIAEEKNFGGENTPDVCQEIKLLLKFNHGNIISLNIRLPNMFAKNRLTFRMNRVRSKCSRRLFTFRSRAFRKLNILRSLDRWSVKLLKQMITSVHSAFFARKKISNLEIGTRRLFFPLITFWRKSVFCSVSTTKLLLTRFQVFFGEWCYKV